jgi:hypothetical protein
VKKTALFLCLALYCLACYTPPPPPPIETWPSRVVTEENLTFYVSGLRIAGTDQVLRVKGATTNLWVPLAQVQTANFTGPVEDRYRRARIFLLDGSSLTVDVFVDFIIQGYTAAGAWNMPMERVKFLEIGTE